MRPTRAQGEVLTAVNVPLPEGDARGAYLKFLPRTAEDYATVSVAAVVSRNPDNTCRDVRIALGAVGMTPVRARVRRKHPARPGTDRGRRPLRRRHSPGCC